MSITDQRYVMLEKWSFDQFSTTHAGEAACRAVRDDAYTHYYQNNKAPHQAKSPHYDGFCRADEYTAWEEWRRCVTQVLAEIQWINRNALGTLSCNVSTTLPGVHTIFENFIIQQSEFLPWSSSPNVTVVFLEFRPLHRQVAFTVRNAMDNLPVHWPIQVVGGPSICALTRRLFPVEVAAGKIALTDLGLDAETHDQDQVRLTCQLNIAHLSHSLLVLHTLL